jgi:hypothetical protein
MKNIIKILDIPGEDGSTARYYIDEDGLAEQLEIKSIDGRIESIRLYEYDDEGREIKQTFTIDGETKWIVEKFYPPTNIHSFSLPDAKEFSSSEIHTQFNDEDGSISFTIRKEFDKKGNRTKEIFYDKNGHPVRGHLEEYLYDEYNNEIEHKMYNEDGSLKRHYFDTYNSDGVKIKSVVFLYAKDGTATEKDLTCDLEIFRQLNH